MREWLRDGFRIVEGVHAAVQGACRSPLNLYYFVVAEKRAGGDRR